MKATATLILIGALVALQPFTANARLFDVFTQDGPQDPLLLEGLVHELGWGPSSGGPFPQSQEIRSIYSGPTQETSCFVVGSDNPAVPNQLIDMINLTGQDWSEVYYVADLDTRISNFDGWMDEGSGPGEAFKIDTVGINRPLVYESQTPDGIFEVGERWTFILQDYATSWGGSPALYNSIGIGGASLGPQSTGSIVAIPEPASLALIGLVAGFGLFIRRFFLI